MFVILLAYYLVYMPAALVPEGDDANNSQCEDPEKMTGSGVNSFYS